MSPEKGRVRSTLEQNKAVLSRFVEEYQSKADVGVAEELLAADFVDHNPFGPLPADRNGVLTLFAMIRGAFPDFHGVIHDQIAEGDKVMTRKTFYGTHRGEFMGIAPTGNEVSFDVIDIVAVRDGKMREHWNIVDSMALMTQLGVIAANA